MHRVVTRDYAVTSDEYARIWGRFQPDPNSGCWLWEGAVIDGYGVLAVTRRTATRRQVNLMVHRLVYAHEVGPISDFEAVDHRCRTTLCVNPGHLRAVTPTQNALENSVGPSALNKAKTHCKRGHEFTPENTCTKLDKRGRKSRMCRTCNRERMRALMRRRRAAT